MISVVIPWRDRSQLRECIDPLVLSVQHVGGDITVVNYGGSKDDLHDQINTRRNGVNVLDVPDQPYFNKAHAHNLGAAATSHPYLFFCDCDILLANGTLAELHQALIELPRSFATLAQVEETNPAIASREQLVQLEYTLRLSVDSGRSATLTDSEVDLVSGLRHAPGLLLLRREDFVAAGGYDASLDGWAWEDQDMIARLVLGLGLEHVCSGTAVHISHGERVRGRAHPNHDRWRSRLTMMLAALGKYDKGRFVGTYAEDLRAASALVPAWADRNGKPETAGPAPPAELLAGSYAKPAPK